MNFKFYTIFLVFILLTTISIMAAPTAETLTADTPAMTKSESAVNGLLDQIVKAAIATLAGFLGILLNAALPVLNQYLKSIMHFRGSSVVADAVSQAIAEMLGEIKQALSDGVLTEDEKAKIKARAKEISSGKLKKLSGFYKEDLHKWIDEVIDVELGKLLVLIFGSKSSNLKTS